MLADESGAFALAGGTDAGDLTGGVDGGDALSGVAAAAVGGSEDSVRSCGCVHCCLTVGLMEGRDGLLERALRCVAVMLCCYSLVRSAQLLLVFMVRSGMGCITCYFPNDIPFDFGNISQRKQAFVLNVVILA
jgi:hypothetical protein